VPRLGQTAGITQQLILDRFAPASVLVNAGAEALYFCGPTDEFLTRPRGIPTQHLLALVRDGLRTRVRAALQQVARDGLPVEVADARMRAGHGYRAVRFTVTPTTDVDDSPLFLVVFQHASPPPQEAHATGADTTLLRQLENDLRSTRDDLQRTAEQLAIAQDELARHAAKAASAQQALRARNEQLSAKLRQQEKSGGQRPSDADLPLQQALQEHTRKLRALAAALALAEERERRSLAQDLHDDLGQMVALIKLKASAMAALKLTAPQRQALAECTAAVDETHRRLRAMTFQLCPPMLHDMGILPALDWLADEIRHVYKLQVAVHDDGQPKPVDPSVSATLFRAVRELLINVARHAQVQAATVSVNVQKVNDAGERLLITVSDTGTGFDPEAIAEQNGRRGFGLLSVSERLGYLGGSMEILSNPGNGTTVVLSVPLLPASGPAGTAHTESRP
jgi:signal transduction histidine kinase